jgi:hypothetical protein
MPIKFDGSPPKRHQREPNNNNNAEDNNNDTKNLNYRGTGSGISTKIADLTSDKRNQNTLQGPSQDDNNNNKANPNDSNNTADKGKNVFSNNKPDLADNLIAGGVHLEGTPNHNDHLVITTINVTSLTKARLTEALNEAIRQNADILCLQETKHRVPNYPWAKAAARKAGYDLRFGAPITAQCGGVAIAWRWTQQKVHVGTNDKLKDHAIAIQWERFRVINMYGSHSPDDDAMRAAFQWASDDHRTTFLVGDLNWKQRYNKFANGFTTDNSQYTTSKSTRPTRCFSSGQAPTHTDSEALPTVPLHRAVTYTLPTPAPAPLPLYRLSKTATYQWIPREDGFNVSPTHPIAVKINEEIPKASRSEPLASRWTAFNKRAEAAFKTCAAEGFCDVVTRSERSKGAPPTLVRYKRSAPHRPDETIAMRRLKRLHRRLATQTRPADQLTRKHKDALRHAKDIVKVAHPYDTIKYGQATDAIVTAINAENAFMAQADTMFYKDKFRQQNTMWGPARRILRPDYSECKVSPTEAHQILTDKWDPHHNDPQKVQADRHNNRRNWVQLADEAQLPNNANIPIPTFDDCAFHLRNAICDARGSAGVDGWTASEIKTISVVFNFLYEELVSFLYDLTFADSASTDATFINVTHLLYTLRVCCLPKKDTIRPISVGSIIVRAWHRALLTCCFPPCSDASQLGGRKGNSVVTAVADWLATDLDCGAELDQASCFDSICQATAAQALARAGVPHQIVHLFRTAWEAPRMVNVAGMAIGTIHPTVGLPQGLPDSPAVCGEVTNAANTAIKRRHGRIRNWAYIDDRTVGRTTGTGNVPKITDVADEIAAMDASYGMSENEDKRQIWHAEDAANATVEHLGLLVNHANPSQDIVPKSSWTTADTVLNRLPLIPGPQNIRCTLATAFLQGCWTWAAPFLAAPPKPHAIAKRVFDACVNSNCTWWCKGRWWLTRTQLHPLLGPALAAFKAAPRVAGRPSEHLHHALSRHADALGLRLVGLGDTGPTVSINAEAPQQLADLVIDYNGPKHKGDPFNFDVTNKHAMHIIRIAARVQCLQWISDKRHDAEGQYEVDVDANSNTIFTNWVDGLSQRQRSVLNVYRCGACKSPTRIANYTGHSACCYCDYGGHASMRHLVVECPHFAEARADVLRKHKTSNGWLRSQPRITTKSGWVTLHAAPTKKQRANLQVAICKLGLFIAEALMTK